MKAHVQFLLSKYRSATISLTGHSTGGALATLAGMDIRVTFKVLINFYSFGQPRVGNLGFSNWVGEMVPPFYRLIHNADIVPHSPPAMELLIPMYFHAGLQVFYDAYMQAYKICAP